MDSHEYEKTDKGVLEDYWKQRSKKSDVTLDRLEQQAEEQRKVLLKFQIVVETATGVKLAAPVLAIYSDMSKPDFKDVWKQVGKAMWERVQNSRKELANEKKQEEQKEKPGQVQTASEQETKEGGSDPANLPGSHPAREDDQSPELSSGPVA